MSSYRRSRHRAVARVLAALSADTLTRSHCYFGGGTRLALELDEYRESQDIDFLCADLDGYRAVRAGIGERTLGAVLPAMSTGLTLLRDVRADQYGIRTVIGVDGEPVKFEIILEARIPLTATTVKGIPVTVLDHPTCFAEKWLANADRWNDTAVLSRDAIDLAFMLATWDPAAAQTGIRLAENAYGAAVKSAASAAHAKLCGASTYRGHCVDALAISDSKRLSAGLRKLKALTKTWPRHP